MIVCSCNVISDLALREAIARAPTPPQTIADIYALVDSKPQCGRCAKTLHRIVRDMQAGRDSLRVVGRSRVPHSVAQ